MAEEQKKPDSNAQMPSIPPLELGDLSMSTTNNTNPNDTTSIATEKKEEEEQQTSTGAGTSTLDVKKEEQPRTSTEVEAARGDKPGPLPAPIDTSMPAMTRHNSEAIGPPTDLPTPMLQPPSSVLAAGPVVQFTLLLASTGTRHPFQLNEKYLNKRNVSAADSDGKFDPASISVYTLKELILKDWREDWDQKPSSPSAIRLIFFGQLLSDNVSLKECKLQTDGTPNVLHITVKPQEVMDDEEAGKGKSSMSRDRDGGDSTPGYIRTPLGGEINVSGRLPDVWGKALRHAHWEVSF
ncbi:Hypothetical protein D9617_23g005290 [Elsinoe fawcettii]|nr:Hypothetical protein D9617_23g005290 [Elsinoe fawcettii]